MVGLLQRVDLANVVAQYGTHSGQFAFQTQNFGRAVGLGILQFLEQSFGTCLLLVEPVDKGVVLDAFFQLAILTCKLGILVFHFLFVEFGQLAQFGQFLLLVFKFFLVAVAGHKAAKHRQGEQGKQQMCYSLHHVWCLPQGEYVSFYSITVVQPCTSGSVPY